MIVTRLRARDLPTGCAAALLLVLLAALALLSASCGPMIGAGAKQTQRFCVVVHNLDVAYAETASVTWWTDGVIRGRQEQLVPAGGEAVFALSGDRPEGFQIDTLAWPASSGGAVWQGPDYSGALIFHVLYPTRVTWTETVR